MGPQQQALRSPMARKLVVTVTPKHSSGSTRRRQPWRSKWAASSRDGIFEDNTHSDESIKSSLVLYSHPAGHCYCAPQLSVAPNQLSLTRGHGAIQQLIEKLTSHSPAGTSAPGACANTQQHTDTPRVQTYMYFAPDLQLFHFSGFTPNTGNKSNVSNSRDL